MALNFVANLQQRRQQIVSAMQQSVQEGRICLGVVNKKKYVKSPGCGMLVLWVAQVALCLVAIPMEQNK